REARTLPLAEPRLAEGASRLSADPVWGEVVEERAAPYLPPAPTAAPTASSERAPIRTEPAARADHAGFFPPRIEAPIEHQSEAARRDSETPPAPIRIERTIAEREVREIAIRNDTGRSEAPQASQKAAERATEQRSADRLFPSARLIEAGYRPGIAARRAEP